MLEQVTLRMFRKPVIPHNTPTILETAFFLYAQEELRHAIELSTLLMRNQLLTVSMHLRPPRKAGNKDRRYDSPVLPPVF